MLKFDAKHNNLDRVAIFILPCLICLIYSNTLHSPWLLDDYRNIIAEPSIHLGALDGESFIKVLKSSITESKIDRPLARLTFAVNWYFGGKDPWGYHLANITIHIICAILLYATIRTFLRTPGGGICPRDSYMVSLFAAAFWAVNPIQTQAVTYIVQRMASLAGMFYLLSLWSYLKGRLSECLRPRLVWFSTSIAAFALGMACKENIVMLPMALIVVEMVFFPGTRNRKCNQRILLIAFGAIVLVASAALVLFLPSKILSVFSYEHRYFTLSERLLTQPRVLLFYLSQIFYPAPFRLSIEHEFTVSTSLIEPWATMPSILIVTGLIVGALMRVRHWPFISFSVLFFFLNHVIESSVIPLELVFEHRNYLPSMFLFVPVAQGFVWAMRFYREKAKLMRGLVGGFAAMLVIGFGTGTYVRNMAWESSETFWADAVRKAPSSGRALAYLAMVRSESPGGIPIALRLYEAALSGTKTNKLLEPEIFNNMAALYYELGDFNQAARYWEKALEKRPEYADAHFRLSLASFKAGRPDEALGHLHDLIAKYPWHIPTRNLRGMVYYWKNDFENALRDFRKVMKPGPEFAAGLLNLGAVFEATGYYDKSDAFLASVPEGSEFMVPALFWKLKSAMTRGDRSLASNCFNKLLSLIDMDALLGWTKKTKSRVIFNDKALLPPLDDKFLQALEGLAQDYIRFQRAQERTDADCQLYQAR